MAEIIDFETQAHLEIIYFEMSDMIPELKLILQKERDREEARLLSLEETGGC